MKKICILMVIAIMAMTTCQDDKIAVTGLNKTSQDDFVIIYVGDTYQMRVNVEPANATEQGVVWTSSNSSIASVDGGVITGLLPGMAEIVAISVDGGKSVSMEVKVTKPVTGIIFKEDLKIARTQKEFPKYGFLPENASDKKLRWSSNNTSVATVDENSGEVTGGMTLGNATITATLVANTEVTGSYNVEVALFPVTAVKLSENKLEIEPKGDATLKYEIFPFNADIKSVKWSTSDETIATVDENGLITGIEEGEVIITVTTDDGPYTDDCLVTVAVGGTEFVRVDADLDDWSGKYLIVYEAQAVNAGTYAGRTVLAFNSGLPIGTVGEAGNVIPLSELLPANNRDLTPITGGVVNRTATDVTVTGGKILMTEALRKAAVTIARVDDGWSIQTASKYYIGTTGGAGTIGANATFTSTSQTHTISIGTSNSAVANNDGISYHNCAIIKSNTSADFHTLRVNSGTGRFGYWGTTSATSGLYNMSPIALYKLQ